MIDAIQHLFYKPYTSLYNNPVAVVFWHTLLFNNLFVIPFYFAFVFPLLFRKSPSELLRTTSHLPVPPLFLKKSPSSHLFSFFYFLNCLFYHSNSLCLFCHFLRQGFFPMIPFLYMYIYSLNSPAASLSNLLNTTY